MHGLHDPCNGKLNQAKMADSPDRVRKATDDEENTGGFEGYDLFCYEMHEEEFDEETLTWRPLSPDTISRSVIPPRSVLLGYDVAVFQENVFPVGCSPLSYNHLAETIMVNEYCLFPTQ